MVKSRRPLLVPPSPSSSSSSPSPSRSSLHACFSSLAASSLSLISHPPHLKPSTASCSPFISSLKRCPLLDIHANLSSLSINPPGPDSSKCPDRQQLERQLSDNSRGTWASSEDAAMTGGSMQEEGGKQVVTCGRARLQQHWIQVGGKVMIPDTWGLEQHLQDWVSYGLVEDAFKPAGLLSARSALVSDCQRRPRGSSSQPPKTADPVQVSSYG